MTILHADGAAHGSPNENSLVVRLDLGTKRVLLMGDAEAGGRNSPSVAPSPGSIEGVLLTCCASELASHVLVSLGTTAVAPLLARRFSMRSARQRLLCRRVR
jgi:hypothetical protein